MPPHSSTPQVFTLNSEFFANYNSLQKGDLFIGRLRLEQGKEFLLLDLASRGINLFPSSLSQHLSRSKVMQTEILGDFMVPHSMVIYNQHDMLKAVNTYGRHNIKQVISKDDRRNAGMGILLWSSVEDVFNQAILGTLQYPFVLQPFMDNCKDVRVIRIGDYWESYERFNNDNFRNNIHCGGKSSSCPLSKEQKEICSNVFARGQFPYGHLDLMITKDKVSYLAEINLRGGIKGAKISPEKYSQYIDRLHHDYKISFLKRQ